MWLDLGAKGFLRQRHRSLTWCRPSQHAAVSTQEKAMTVSDFGPVQTREAIEYFVDACEIGRMLGIDHRTVQQMARDGVIPA